MINVNHNIKYPNQIGKLFHDSLGYIDTIDNELQLFDIQIQIAKENTSGYYIEWNNNRIDINPNGELSSWPLGWLDECQHAIIELSNIRAGNNVYATISNWRHI